MSKAAFLIWAQGVEGRYELADGHVVVMIGATFAHACITGNLMALLRGQLDLDQWTVLSDFGVDTGDNTLRSPDIVIDRAGANPDDVTATAPMLLVEVTSPSSKRIDLADKPAEYLRLPSLAAYLAFAEDEHTAHV